MSVAYSTGAVQFELEQVLRMLINCIAVFHRPLLPPPPPPSPPLCPEPARRPLDKQVVT